MNTHRLNKLCIAAAVAFGLGVGAASRADETTPEAEAVEPATLQGVLKVSEERNAAALKSQQRIDKLAEQTHSLLTEYRTVIKQVESLKVHNARLRKQIADQKGRLEDIKKSIAQAVVTQRQMLPLVIRMIDGLEQFVELDVPFDIKERRERISFLRGNINRSDVSVAEKFRQVLEAYKIEGEYGRKIDSYKGSVEIDGVERDVNFLRVGRVALLYQTTDTDLSGAWDQASRSWVELSSGAYRNAIMKGLRIARKEASIDLLNLPIAAPEVATQ